MPKGTTTGASAQITPDHHALSFVKVEFKGPRKQRLTDWFAVPDEDYCTGNARGYRVAAELMAWLQTRPATYETGFVTREIIAAAFAVLAEPCTQGNAKGMPASWIPSTKASNSRMIRRLGSRYTPHHHHCQNFHPYQTSH